MAYNTPSGPKKQSTWLGWGVALTILAVIGATNSYSPQTNQQIQFDSDSPATSTQSSVDNNYQTPVPTDSITPTPSGQTTQQPTNCTNGSYVNSEGNTVCSPEYSPSVPAGATAKCRDGTYSYSQHRSGTCSHHGGVAQWL